jgi:hypothetical protein
MIEIVQACTPPNTDLNPLNTRHCCTVFFMQVSGILHYCTEVDLAQAFFLLTPQLNAAALSVARNSYHSLQISSHPQYTPTTHFTPTTHTHNSFYTLHSQLPATHVNPALAAVCDPLYTL